MIFKLVFCEVGHLFLICYERIVGHIGYSKVIRRPQVNVTGNVSSYVQVDV